MVLNDKEETQWWSVRCRLYQTDGPVEEIDPSPNSFVFTRGMTKIRVWLCKIRKILRGVAGNGVEADSKQSS